MAWPSTTQASIASCAAGPYSISFAWVAVGIGVISIGQYQPFMGSNRASVN